MRLAGRIRTTRRELSAPNRTRPTPRVRERAIVRNPPVRHRYSMSRRSIRPGGRVAPYGCPAPPPRNMDPHHAIAPRMLPSTPLRTNHLRAQHHPRAVVRCTTTASMAGRRKPPTIRPPGRCPAQEPHLSCRGASSVASRPHHRHPVTTSNVPPRHRTHPATSSTARRPHHTHPAATYRSHPSYGREPIPKGAPGSRSPVGRNAIANPRRPDGAPARIRPVRVQSSRDRGHRRQRVMSRDVRGRDRREPRPNPSSPPGPRGSRVPVRRNGDVDWPRLVGPRTRCPERRAYRCLPVGGTGCHWRSTRPKIRVGPAMMPRRPILLPISKFRPASSRRRMGPATEEARPELCNPQ